MVTSADLARIFEIPESSIPKLVAAMSTNGGRLTRTAVENHTGRKIGKTIVPNLEHQLRLLNAPEGQQISSTTQASTTRLPITIKSTAELETAINQGSIKQGDAVEIQSLITPKGRDIFPVWEVKSPSKGTIGLVRIPNGTTDTLILLINDIKPKPNQLDTPNMSVKTHSRNINMRIIPKQD